MPITAFMRFTSRTYRIILSLALILGVTLAAMGQATTVVYGTVLDSLSRRPLSNATVILEGSDRGAMTDSLGRFSISTVTDFSQVRIALLGYETAYREVKRGRKNKLDVLLSPSFITLDEVLVRPEKEKYNRKNNPAIDFAHKVIARRNDFDARREPYFAQRRYEKTTFAINDFNETVAANPFLRSIAFLSEYAQQSDVTGSNVLNLALQERVVREYSQASPRKQREVVEAVNRMGLEGLADSESFQTYVAKMFSEVDLFSNNIVLFDQQFVSPLNKDASSFYKFYLLDTLLIDGVECIDLGFAAFNPHSLGFAGHLYVVADDTTCFVKRARYTIPQDINLNYVNRMVLQQDYARDSLGRRMKVYDDIVAEFSMIPGMPELYARRTITYSDFSFDAPQDEDIFTRSAPTVTLPTAFACDSLYWEGARPQPLAWQEAAIKEVTNRLLELPLFKWFSKVAHVVMTGYIGTHPIESESRFDVGPVTSFISGNTIETVRLKVAGTTTPKLHPHLFASGYVAYGFGDDEWKYGLSLEYSFNKKKRTAIEYPIRSLRAFYEYDLNYLSQRYLHTQRDNFVLSLRRGPDYYATYLRKAGIEMKYEFDGGLSLELGLRNERQKSTPHLPFNIRCEDGSIRAVPHLQQTMGEVCLRYSPSGCYTDAYGKRRNLDNDAIKLTLRHIFSIKSFLSDYDYNRTEIAVSKRFRMSMLGYADVILKAGKVWNDVPYPLLFIPHANMSYTVQPESFSLIQPMEFIFDQYASWDLTYYANGLLFNVIPWVNKLNLREVITFRGIYGRLRDNNKYPEQTGLFLFNPEWNFSTTGNMLPYMEMSVGIDNILSVLRIDYVFRLSYRDVPGVDKGGFRVALHIGF